MAKKNEAAATEAAAVTEKAAEVPAEDTPKRVLVKLPRLKGNNANQDEFFSVNFKNYIVKRGEYVEIPSEVYEVIKNSEKAEDAAFKFVEEHAIRQPKAE